MGGNGLTGASLSLQQLARALGGEVSKTRVLAPGPGHSAADRSLSIKLDAKAPGGFLVHSFSGDDPIKCRDYIRQKAGLPPWEAKANGRNHPTEAEIENAVLRAAQAPISSKKYGPVVARFNYTDRNGKLLYQVQRHEPKTFSQRRPDGNGGWIDNMDGVQRVLYRWPELITFPDATILFTEGEKDADRVASLGHCATTIASGKWTDDCAQALAGRAVWILEDNDHAGRKRALAAAKTLHSKATTIRIVRFPNLPDGGDVSDWLDADPHRADQLVDMCVDAPLWSPSETAEPSISPINASEADAALRSVRASTITPTAISWLWPNRFALGKLGILAGLPDEGKGQILADISARVTRGLEWPCDEGCAPQGNVILLTAEDAPSDTVVPRLIAAGADLARVEIVGMVRTNNNDRMFSLVTDLPLLRQKVAEVGDVKLIQIDPITAYLGIGKVDSFRTTDVRAVLGPLVDLAAEFSVSIIGIMHFNKKSDVTNALLRISDSLAFGATARHVYCVVDDAENDRKLFVKGKNNLAPYKQAALAYGFGVRDVGVDPETNTPISAPHIIWHPQHIDVTASEAMAAANNSKAPAARDSAKKFLADLLANGPVPKAEIEDAAEANCISNATLRRAKADLGIIARKDNSSPRGGWVWHLPDGKPWHDDP